MEAIRIHNSPPTVTSAERKGYRKGIVCAILAGCSMSTVGILIRHIKAADEWQVIFYRSITLAVMLIGVMLINHRSRICHGFAQAGMAAIAAGLFQAKDMLPALFFAGIFSAIASAFMVEGFSLSLRDLLLCIALGVFGLGLSLILFTWASRHVPAAELVLLALTEVILGPFWVWIGVGETPSTLTLIGGLIMLAAIVGNAITGLHRKFPKDRIDHR